MVEPAARNSIVAALKSWDRNAVTIRVAEAEALRVQFVERFPRNGWPNLPLDEYALGQGSHDNVAYWMESKTTPIGSIKGGSAHKHLIFQAKDGSWSFPKEYASADEVWSAIRAGFVEILAAATAGNLDIADDIAALISAPALRTKLLTIETNAGEEGG